MGPKRDQPRIAVVCGGPSSEAAVSRSSAAGVAGALRETFAHVEVLELTPTLADELRRLGTEVVFPTLHGSPGEDGTFQGFLEILGLPYVGSDVYASAFAMDKVMAKHAFRARGLPVAPDAVVFRSEPAAAAVQRVIDAVGPHVAIKPARSGSGIGVAFARTTAELEAGLVRAFEHGDKVLVEPFRRGREMTVGVIDRAGAEAFPVIEIRTPEGSWYDYEHRYTQGLSEHLCPAPLLDEHARRIQDIAIAAHQALGCRDLSRADFIVTNEGEPTLLEVNTLPGMTPTSLYPEGAAAVGLSFPALVRYFIERALARR